MIFKSLSKYSFLNAKIRSKIGRLLPEEKLESIRENFSYPELVEFLQKIGYIPDDSHVYSDEKLMEFYLKENLINEIKNIYLSASESSIKKFIQLLLAGFEVEEIKNALRVWFRYKNTGIIDSGIEKLFHNNINFYIPYDKIIYCDTIEEIQGLLSHTPYAGYITYISKEKFNKRKSIFYIELELDKKYYNELFSEAENLSKSDQKIVEKFIGFEIDVNNLLWLFRYKFYYNLNPEEAFENLIGVKKDTKILQDLYLAEHPDLTKVSVFKSISSGITDRFLKQVDKETDLKKKFMLIEALLNQTLFSEVKKALSGYPFNIGVILGYIFLKKSEIKNLINIGNLKFYEII